MFLFLNLLSSIFFSYSESKIIFSRSQNKLKVTSAMSNMDGHVACTAN